MKSWNPIPSILTVGMAVVMVCGCKGPGQSRRGKGAVATGRYPNLFAGNGHSEQESRAKVNAAFQQLFHGDPGTQAVYFDSGTNFNGPLAYITDIKHNDVRTEGMSYGMMIAVQLDHQTEFNALWNWSKTYMYNRQSNHPSYGFFSWSLKTNGVVNSDLVAPDGEEYYVTALYFAAHRWGNGRGIYNYQAEADQLLSRMLHRKPIRGQTKYGLVRAGPLFDEDHKMVLFSPSTEVPKHTDPSYHLPAFYELWAAWGPAEDREFWRGAAAASRAFFPRVTNPRTGLNPDYATFEGLPHANRRNKNTVDFRFDAWRTAMNWSVDWSWWGAEPRERELSDRMQAFFESSGMGTYGCQFTLDGEVLDKRHATGLVAMNAVASLASTQSRSRDFVEALWTAPVPEGIERYYDGLLYLMALMHCSGQFQCWGPP